MNASESDRTQPPASPPLDRQPRLFLLMGVAAVLVVAAVFAGLEPRWRQQAALAAETQELAVPTVTVVSPAPTKAPPGLLLPAETKPWVETAIYARANGYLKRWTVDIGAHVEADQLLGEIETPELRQELERARHELAQAEVSQALTKLEADRSARLVKSGSISEEENDQSKADFALRTAMVKASGANVRRLEELLSFARVTAPFAGIVTARRTDVGDLIAGGGVKELFRMAQTDKLRVYVRVPQTRALAVAPGQTAELLVPELPKRVFEAKVASTAGEIAADSRTLLTELHVDNADGAILAGSFAQVRFAQAQGASSLMVPGNALLFRAEGPQVALALADGKVELRNVKLGCDFGQTVEILDGVGPTDRIIINPSDSLMSGVSVRIADAAGPEKPK